MIPFIEKLFPRKRTESAKKFMKTAISMVKLSTEIKDKTTKLTELEYNTVLEKKNETVIFLSDLLAIFDKSDLKLTDIISKCKHVSEVDPLQTSSVEVYSIIEDNHMVLCPDIKECEKHLGVTAQKISIVSLKRK